MAVTAICHNMIHVLRPLDMGPARAHASLTSSPPGQAEDGASTMTTTAPSRSTFEAICARVDALGFNRFEGPNGFATYETAYQAAARGATDAEVLAHVKRARKALEVVDPTVVGRFDPDVRMAQVSGERFEFAVFSDRDVVLAAEDLVDVEELGRALQVVQDVLVMMDHDGVLPYPASR